ncbi:MAG: hypothetical protein KF752_10240 [Pirellulaceae bacterium]|nr:hypothetical protein [Pirellulaceae bacterium]
MQVQLTRLAMIIGTACLLGFHATAQEISRPDAEGEVTISVPSQQMQPLLNDLAGCLAQKTAASTLPDGKIQFSRGTQRAILSFDPQNSVLRLSGTAQLTAQIAQLCRAYTDNAAGNSAKIIPLNSAGQACLIKQAVFQSPEKAPASGSSQIPSQLPSFRGFRRVQLTASAAQEESTESTGAPSQGDEAKAEELRGLPLQQFDGVQVEMLPEIDAIILRGRDKQLEGLAEIIKQLDEASRLAEPEIEVLLLQHVSSQSLAPLLQSTQQAVLATRQGRVQITGLYQPNAILLIGWGDALKISKDLISKLDRPVPPSSMLDVIPLKHAVASQLQTQLQSLFQTRTSAGSLSPIIQSAIDARTNALIIHAAPRDLEEIRQLIVKLDIPRGQAMQQAKVFEIRHSLAADIAAALRQAVASSTAEGSLPIELIDKDGQPIASSSSLSATRITVNDRNNTLIVSAAPENLNLIQQLIAQLDTPGMVAKIKIFPIINADASSLVETLRSLIPSQSSAATNSSPQLSASADESSLVPLRFTVDGRGNNIIVVGSEGDLKIVEALIVRLDESDTMQRKSTVYRLKNAPAVDIALAVNEFLRNKRQVEAAAPGAINPFDQLEREVVVVPEPVQNKLILSATPRYYDEISRLIEQLDQQPPQVMIQVLIAEISLGTTHEFGMELGLQSSVLFDRSLLGDLLKRTTSTSTSTPGGVVTETIDEIVAASNTPGFNFNNSPLGNSGSAKSLAKSGVVGGQGLSNFSVGRNNERLGFGGLVLSASSENVSFLLRALQDCRRLEILSRPQVLTLDNQQAFIQVGQRIPRITTANVTQFGFQTGVTLENVGLILGVTPRISPEGNVVMEIDAEKSKIRPESEGIPISVAQDGSVIRSPILDTITAQATVSAADGETIILGGLISKETNKVHRKVPWLGDIPVLKNLFRYELDEMNRSELLIILTPHVIRNEVDMQRLKQAEFARVSWCEADVFDIHGDVRSYAGLTSHSLEGDQWPIVYPDVDPRGIPAAPVQEAMPISPGTLRHNAPASMPAETTRAPGSLTTVLNELPIASSATVPASFAANNGPEESLKSAEFDSSSLPVRPAALFPSSQAPLDPFGKPIGARP